MEQLSVCLLNDSFPPQIDGVSNTVVNYALCLQEKGAKAMAVTPHHPKQKDDGFSFPVVRFPSVPFPMAKEYMAGIPFSPEAARKIKGQKVNIIHSHCPIVSTFMARQMRDIVDAPLILTYHTKFDIDIANVIKPKHLREMCVKALAENIRACDEVWTVSRGAGENLRENGYEGEYVIMPNGVDLPRGRVSDEAIFDTTGSYDLPQNVPVYLFVGRLMWYKGIRIILDALAKLMAESKDFRMVFIGTGADRKTIEEYCTELNVAHKCIFTGPIHDREALRAWYCRSDLFLFPSTFDTNGLVVREAAACDLPAVLVAGSCAAEGIADGRNGFLMEENAQSLYVLLRKLQNDPGLVKTVGENAGKELYLSWSQAVDNAVARYETVLERHRSGLYPPHKRMADGFFHMNADLMNALSKLPTMKR